MGEWAHEVRLGANRPRHSDQENPHVSPQEAQQSVEFAKALAHFLFVLSSRVKKGNRKREDCEVTAVMQRLRVGATVKTPRRRRSQ
jgi:hypothetical protein